MLEDYRDAESGRVDWGYWWSAKGDTILTAIIGVALYGSCPVLILLHWVGVIDLSVPKKPEPTKEQRVLSKFSGTYDSFDGKRMIRISELNSSATLESNGTTIEWVPVQVVGEDLLIPLSAHDKPVRFRYDQWYSAELLVPECGEIRCLFVHETN